MLNFGLLNIDKISAGSNPINRVCWGNTEVWAFVEDTDPYLTIDITGLDDEYEVAVDGVVWPNNKKSFPSGTTLDNLVVTVSGYTITPSVVDNVIITGNTTLYFTATPNEAPDANLLSGHTYLRLSPDLWTEVQPNVWQQTTGLGSGNVSMKLRIFGDGSIFYKYVNDGLQYIPEIDIRDEEIAGNQIYFWMNSGKIGWEATDSGGLIGEEYAVDGTFYGLIKTGNNIKAVKTLDGITFTELYDYGTRLNHTYVGTYRYNGGGNKWYYPQGKGLTVSFNRAWSIDLGSEFSETPVETGITWNTFKPNFSQISTPSGLTLSNMVTEDNSSSTLSITNLTAFGGASNTFANYMSTNPVYPIVAVNSGLSLDEESIFRVSGANPSKVYTVSVLCTSTESNSAASMTIGANTAEKVNTDNYPLDGSNRYSNNSLGTLINVIPNGAGEIDIILNKTGSWYQTTVNLILIQEYN